MAPTFDLRVLIDYTEWERRKWFEWLRAHGDPVLQIAAGPHGDGRFQTIGQVIRHIFSAEKRYIDRLSGRSLTDTSAVPTDDIESLFKFSQASRRDLKEFIESCPPEKWEAAEEHKIIDRPLLLTTRKIVIHVLLHEIRHWAQIATIFRLQGLTGEFHDFLFSPVLAAPNRKNADGI